MNYETATPNELALALMSFAERIVSDTNALTLTDRLEAAELCGYAALKLDNLAKYSELEEVRARLQQHYNALR